jgi:L-seryl-tRNA(Ser) seleniumtransferase
MVENGRFNRRTGRGGMDRKASLRNLPSVERVLEDERIAVRINTVSRRGITRIVRDRIESYREGIISGRIEAGGDASAVLESIAAAAAGEIGSLVSDRLRRVINATGVILHTNLGRAVLDPGTASAVLTAASGYTDLEMDIGSGTRASRSRRVTSLLRAITGCGGALVVNNNAAAVLLAVDTFARDGAVAVSRGELVEIGGSFRLPEILARAAGRVIEIGTTNRTNLGDYERAVDEGATLLLKVHTSNYRVVGYTDEVSLAALTELGRKRKVPVMYDQGSGILYPVESEGFEGEESIFPLLDTGVDIVSFSGDKVLGGPQSGILLGEAGLIGLMRDNHLSRALRIDKMTLAGLEQVLVHYWNGHIDRIPALRMILEDRGRLEARTRAVAERLIEKAPAGSGVEVVEGETSIGGGSFPINPLRTVLLRITLTTGGPQRLERELRRLDPPVLVRVKGDSVFMDLRTVRADEEDILIDSLAEAMLGVKEKE